MVVFVDFGEESSNDDAHDPAIAGGRSRRLHQQAALRNCNKITPKSEHLNDNGSNGNDELGNTTQLFARSLGCYPIVSSITSHLDLNTLHALSRTCSLFRRTLLPFRPQLVTQTLRCSNDLALSSFPKSQESRTASADLSVQRIYTERRLAGNTMTRAGPCARDMVGGCRRCGTIVCRNCIAKPLSRRFIKERVRRLCATCANVPIRCHLFNGGNNDKSSTASSPSDGLSNKGCEYGSGLAFTSSAFARDPCICEETAWLCKGCGGSLHTADVTYKRVWTWRSRYSTHIGGLGTGMGEGDQGQKCGKGESCAEANDIEVEIDCSAEVGNSPSEWLEGNGVVVGVDEGRRRGLEDQGELGGLESGWAAFVGSEGGHEGSRAEKNGRIPEGPGYLRQEIEGIGGVVKKKVKKRVRVGATVQEFEDERETGRYLDREENGLLRSWCGWCDRVVLRNGEIAET